IGSLSPAELIRNVPLHEVAYLGEFMKDLAKHLRLPGVLSERVLLDEAVVSTHSVEVDRTPPLKEVILRLVGPNQRKIVFAKESRILGRPLLVEISGLPPLLPSIEVLRSKSTAEF